MRINGKNGPFPVIEILDATIKGTLSSTLSKISNGQISGYIDGVAFCNRLAPLIHKILASFCELDFSCRLHYDDNGDKKISMIESLDMIQGYTDEYGWDGGKVDYNQDGIEDMRIVIHFSGIKTVR